MKKRNKVISVIKEKIKIVEKVIDVMPEGISAISAELMLIIGAFLFVAATARISITLTLYLLGVFFFAGGFFIAKNRR